LIRSGSTVVVAMSGGVDSSLAAALLVEQGHRVVGVTMKTFCYEGAIENSRTCCGLDGILDARRVCDTLDIPHYVFDLEESFAEAVIDDFVDEYVAGRTPNPCVRCNSNTKIPELLRRARMFGADRIATGHYARMVRDGDDSRLLRGVDRRKDQSYFLWALPREVLQHLDFPVGELTKDEVRRRAAQLELATADKPESQEICFVPSNDYGQFLAHRLGADHPSLRPGTIVRRDGSAVGTHEGYGRYTVGQRRRLGGGARQRLYVLEVRPERNEVVVGESADLYGGWVRLIDLNWFDGAPAPGETVQVQIRHGGRAVAARVEATDADELMLRLDEPQRAITPGQSGAVYRGEELLGGGRIARAA